jgi:hypothetical protein
MMFLYGHMLKEGDKVPYKVPGSDQPTMLVVGDIWPSKYRRGQWAELWTPDSDAVALRNVAMVYIPDMEELHDVEPPLQVGTSRKYAPTYAADAFGMYD